jgi:hypothetical protein
MKTSNEARPTARFNQPINLTKIVAKDEATGIEGHVHLNTASQSRTSLKYNQIIQLTIVPMDLCQHIFDAFHANPLGGLLSLYYALHQI